MKKDPAETMRVFGAVREAIQAYQQEHGTGPGSAFALFGDEPISIAFLLSNPARTADDTRALQEKLDMLKSKGLSLGHIASVAQVVTA